VVRKRDSNVNRFGRLAFTLQAAGSEVLKLRYVTDAGCHPQAYYRDVLCKMKHPLTGRRLKWTWCVDFFHACEYVSQLAASLFVSGTDRPTPSFRRRWNRLPNAGKHARRETSHPATNGAFGSIHIDRLLGRSRFVVSRWKPRC
jgi:hypothetical protein